MARTSTVAPAADDFKFEFMREKGERKEHDCFGTIENKRWFSYSSDFFINKKTGG